jgi:hypothetical protein
LVGKIGWDRPPAPAAGPQVLRRASPLRYYTLLALGVLFLASLGRWIYQLFHVIPPARRPSLESPEPAKDLSDDELDAWVHSVSDEKPDEMDLSN